SGQNNVFELIGKIGGIEQAQSSPAKNVALLGALELFAHEGGSLEAYLDGGMAAALEPFDQLGDLGRASGAIGALDDYQFAGQFAEINSRDTVTIKAPLRWIRNNNMICGRTFHSIATSRRRRLCNSLAGAGTGRSARRNCSRPRRWETSSRTSDCCFSTSS